MVARRSGGTLLLVTEFDALGSDDWQMLAVAIVACSSSALPGVEPNPRARQGLRDYSMVIDSLSLAGSPFSRCLAEPPFAADSPLLPSFARARAQIAACASADAILNGIAQIPTGPLARVGLRMLLVDLLAPAAADNPT